MKFNTCLCVYLIARKHADRSLFHSIYQCVILTTGSLNNISNKLLHIIHLSIIFGPLIMCLVCYWLVVHCSEHFQCHGLIEWWKLSHLWQLFIDWRKPDGVWCWESGQKPTGSGLFLPIHSMYLYYIYSIKYIHLRCRTHNDVQCLINSVNFIAEHTNFGTLWLIYLWMSEWFN